jgi:3-hydroxyisobutyrate dehydrogenase-like beta-hydroxyacid dehydrogenase
LVALALLGTAGLWLTLRVRCTLRRMNTTTTTNAKNLQVGFVGLGDQGAPMAIAIAEAGWPLRVWARHERSYEALGDVSYERCESVEELGRRSDVVGLCLTDDADVWQLLDDQRLLSALPPGGIVVNHGTGDPQVAIELANHGDANGHAILDAPVSGGRPAAARKALTTFVGGKAQAADTCRPVFEAFSTTVAYMGQAGAGQMTKLMNNASLLANLRNAEEIISIGAAAGLDPRELVDVLQTGSGSSFALQFLAGEISPEMASHLPDLWHKDIGHFSDAIRDRDLPPTVLEARAHEAVADFRPTLNAIASSRRN